MSPGTPRRAIGWALVTRLAASVRDVVPAGRADQMDLERMLRLGVRLLPADRAQWGRALVAELDGVPADARSRWVLGGARFVLQEVVIRPGVYLLGLCGAVAALVWVDLSPSDVANQASLLVLLLGAGLLGL